MVWDLFVGAGVAALASLIACGLLISVGPIDRPFLRRHAHDAPTPTSGGIGIAVGFIVGLLIIAMIPDGTWGYITFGSLRRLFISVGFACVFMLIGFWDDAHPLGARTKFIAFALLSISAAIVIEPVDRFPIGDGVWEAPVWLGVLGTALWIFVMVNGVNFMDGANGLAMGSVTIGLLALAATSLAHGGLGGLAASLTAAGAICGFLYWNFPRGRLFAGDSGALFTGALAALVSIVVIHRTGISPFIPAILFFPLLGDVLVTLAWRAWRRRSLFDGHSEHLYQIACHGGMTHTQVSLIYWSAMVVSGIVGFWAAQRAGDAPMITLAALALVAIAVSAAVRRFADRHGIQGV